VCSKEELTSKEQEYIDKLKPKYNVRKIADRNTGVKRSKEVCAKIAEYSRNRIWTEESKRKIGRAHKGKKISDKMKHQVSITLKKKRAEGMKFAWEKPIILRNIETGIEEEFGNMIKAGEKIGCSNKVIWNSCKNGHIIKKQYKAYKKEEANNA